MPLMSPLPPNLAPACETNRFQRTALRGQPFLSFLLTALKRYRWFLLALITCGLLVTPSGPVVAQRAQREEKIAPKDEGIPNVSVGGTPIPVVNFSRGQSLYFNLISLASVIVVIWCWTFSCDWINRDSQRIKLAHEQWNLLAVGTFVVGMLIAFKVAPAIWAALPVLLLAWAVPLGVYVLQRNPLVDEVDRVLTPRHLKFLAFQGLRGMGMKNVSSEKKDPVELGKAAKVVPKSGKSAVDDNVLLYNAKQSAGFWPVSELVAEAITQRADGILMDLNPEQTTVRFELDGVWHEREPVDAELGLEMMTAVKTLSGVKVEDRRNRQVGKVAVEFKGQKLTGKLTSQGTKSGERVVLQFEKGKSPFKTYDDIGMPIKLQEKLRNVMRSEKGLVLFSALPAHGLSTLIDVTLTNTDRYMRNFVQIESKDKREREIENIAPELYDPADPDDMPALLERVIRSYPDAIVCRDGYTEPVLKRLLGQVDEGRLVILSNQAKDAAEAMVRVLVAKAPREVFAKSLVAVVYQRLIRKLCESCKVAYETPPEILKRLRVTSEQLEFVYRAPTPEENDKGCKACSNLGYSGRTGLFELVIVNDAIRELLVKSPKVELLKQAIVKAGTLSLQDGGLVLVGKGLTSTAELARVLKE